MFWRTYVYFFFLKKLRQKLAGFNSIINLAGIDNKKHLDDYARYEKFIVHVMSETSEAGARRIIEAADKSFGVCLREGSSVWKIKKQRPTFKAFNMPVCQRDIELNKKYNQEIKAYEEQGIEIPQKKSGSVFEDREKSS